MDHLAAACERLADALVEQEVLRAGQDEPAGPVVMVSRRLFDSDFRAIRF